MNYVLVGGDGEVVMRSSVAFETVPDGLVAFGTEAWPAPGMVCGADGSFSEPVPAPISVEKVLAARLNELADLRWRKEEAGTSLQQVSIATDRASQGKLTAAYIRAQADPSYSVNWKTGPGAFVTLDAAFIIGAADAAAAHVQDCFDREMELSAELLSASKTSGNADAKRAAIAAVDIAADWPA